MPLFFWLLIFYGSLLLFYDVVSIVSQTLNKIFSQFSLASCICSLLRGQFTTDSVSRPWVWSKSLVILGCSFSYTNWSVLITGIISWAIVEVNFQHPLLGLPSICDDWWWQMLCALRLMGRGDRPASWWYFSNKRVGKVTPLGHLRRFHSYSRLPLLN